MRFRVPRPMCSGVPTTVYKAVKVLQRSQGFYDVHVQCIVCGL